MDALSISVVRYVKEASRILAYPFFSVAYFLQSGGPIWYFKLNFEYAKNFLTLNNMGSSSFQVGSLRSSLPRIR